jgi:LmbE family N-acetylglucosaminyl deacetylase
MSRFILCIGAHPDDNEYSIGGTAALLCRRGDRVKFVAVTNGNKGHFADEYRIDPPRLAERRRQEALRAAAVIGVEYEIWDVPDGEIYVTPALTERMIRQIRSFGPPGHGPDLVLLNRPVDYHRDHRYGAQLVLDATYMLTVPLICPETPHLQRMPVFAYWADDFTEGSPFRADVGVAIDTVVDVKAELLYAHESQFFEWLPYNMGWTAPSDPQGRRAHLVGMVREMGRRKRVQCGGLLPETSAYAEAFQISEYGKQPTEEELAALFPCTG